MMPRRIGFVLGPLLAAATLGLAQEQTGSLAGTLRDTQGGAVPGAVVVARSASGLSVRLVTGADGTYLFPALPPGTYELTSRRDGFAPVKVERIDLRLGFRLTIDLTLEPARISQAVEVSAEAPLISITRSAHTTSLRDEQIEKMPRGRGYASVIGQVPGVNDEPRLGGYSIDGASAPESRYLIDGAEATSLVQGLPRHQPVTDFVDEVQVKSSGYSAEFGGSTGGVVSALTRSGTNEWHGDALFYWSSDALDGGPRPSVRLDPTDSSVAQPVTYPEDAYDRFEPGFVLSGPLVRDRAWLFAGYIPSFRPLDRTVTFRADDSARTFRQDLRVDNLAASVSAELSPRWRLRTSFTSTRLKQHGELPLPDGTGDPTGDYGGDVFRPRYSLSASLDFLPASNAYVSVRAGYYDSNVHDENVYQGDLIWYGSSSLGFPGVPPESQHPLGYQNVVDNYVDDRIKENRLNIQLDATILLSGAGRHQLKGGIQLDRLGLDVLQGRSGNKIDVFWGQAFFGQRGPFGYYRIWSSEDFPNRALIGRGSSEVNNVGLFVQDSWTIGERLTLNLGLRTENERVPSFSADPARSADPIGWGFGDKLAPRLGFAWDVRGSGKTKIYGSWGVFYDIMKLTLPFNLFGGTQLVAYWHTLDSPDLGQIENNDACPPDCPGRRILGPVDFVPEFNDAVDPEVEPMKLREAAIGVEQELAADLSVGARFVHKRLDRAVEDIGQLDTIQGGTSLMVGNPGYGEAASFVPRGGTAARPYPRARRDYDAVEVALDKRMSAGWSARLSYTWSRLWGSYSGLSQSDQDGRVAPNLGFNFDYPMMAFDERGEPVYGELATDRPHQIKAHLLCDFRFGTSFGLSWYGGSGIPRTRVAAFVPGSSYPVMYRGRNSDGRMPFVSRLDLYVQHRLRLGDRLGITLSASVVDQATPVNYFQDELLAGQAIQVSDTAFYEGIDTQQLIDAQGLLRDPRFLMDKDYQPPRQVRLGVKVGF
jgi:hypothetical protein